MQTVIIDRVEGLLRTGLEEWAGRRGLDGPRGLSLSAPPAHIPADLSTSFPFQAAKQARTAPVKVAEELAESLRALFVTDASTGYSPPGFLNLTLTDSALGENLAALLADPQGYAKAPGAPPPPTLFEFVSANPTGPLHMASGRAATLGDALVRIHRRLGWKADAEYYVNDEGRQVQLLGQSLKARFLQHRGREASVPEGGYQGEYLRAMAREIPEDAEGWPDERFRAHAVERLLAAHREDMEAFQVRFDRWARESELHRSGAIPKTLEALKGKGLVHEKEGAVWFGLASEGADDKDRVLVRSDGRPTYFLADIAYHHDKLQRGYGRLVDIWGADHHGYVPRMRAAVDALGRPGSFVPVIHQLVHLFRGREAVRMSKRAGEFVTLRELVEDRFRLGRELAGGG